ncbi:MAG: MoaD/ThiS family protein [Gemmataceae bacterium]
MNLPREMCTVEFFGLARARAGRAEIHVEAATPRELLGAIERACPRLAPLVQENRLHPSLLLSLDGTRFLIDLEEHLPSGSRILLLSADAGG